MAFKAKAKIADELGVDEKELDKAAKHGPYENMDGPSAIEIDVDFDAPAGDGPYPNGTYHAKLEHVEKRVAKSGNMMLVWRFRTLHDKRAFWLNTVLTRDAKWKVDETAVACGAKGEGQVKIDVSKLVGNPCRIVIVNEIYEGEMRPGIKKALPPTEATHDLNELG